MFVSRLLSAKESDKLNKGTISSSPLLNLSFFLQQSTCKHTAVHGIDQYGSGCAYSQYYH